MFRRLEVKIIASLALILTAMIAVYGSWIGNRQAKVYVQTLSDNLRILSRSLADNAAHFIVIQEYAGLEAHMLDTAHMPEVMGIMVTESDGKLLCNIARPSRRDQPKLSYRIRKIAVPERPEAILKRQGDQLVSWAPITAGNHLGWVKMTLHLDTAHRLQGATWQSTLQIGIIWILVGTLLMVLVVKKPLRAVGELSRFAHELQTRKGAQVTLRRGVYEIDMLADALNHSSRELLKAEQRLLAEQERLSVTLQSIGDGVIATDTGSRIVLVNQVAEHLTGWSEEEAIGRDLEEVFHLQNGEWAETNAVLRTVLTENRTVELGGQYPLLSRDGTSRTVSLNGAPIIDSNNELAGMVLVIRDISERARMEEEKRVLAEQLLQSQKMEAIGQLAGGVAHDFNNMLGVIMGHAELGMMSLAPLSPLHERLKGILDAANRSADITRQLLAFSRQQPAEPRVLDLNDAISKMLKMLHRLIGEDTELSWSPGFNLHRVKLDPTQLDQIMANLCVNARDAIAGVGEIDISTENVRLAPGDLAKPVDLPVGDYVTLVVKDSGCGMTREVMERIFEPFYTTKLMGRGTGLGLATVFGIIKQNNGHIEVDSEPGKGTTFRLYLPAVQGEVDQPETAGKAVGGTEAVLLVEDEPAIRELTCAMLERLGYKVLAAESPEEALRIAGEEDVKLDLLLTDIIMPIMNGRELSQHLTLSHPDLKCLFMSGYTADIIAERGQMEQEMSFLQKPFTVQALAAKVRETLQKA